MNTEGHLFVDGSILFFYPLSAYRLFRMRSWFLALTAFTLVSGTVVATGLLFMQPAPSTSLEAAEPPAWDAVAEVLAERKKEIDTVSEIPFGTDTQINILALGLDSRKEGRERHCDAIHMVTLDLSNWSMKITSVPRGTVVPIPGTYEPSEYYIANACAFAGLDYGVSQIENIVGVKADYVATVGFSQALGIFRALELPTTETLQWLRHRRSFQIGDPQRSHNQAVFMKDTVLKLLGGDGISTPLMYLLYSLVDTDLDFKTAQALYTAYRAAQVADRPDDIVLDMKPYFVTQDMHFDPNNPEEQVQELIDRLQGRVSSEDLSNRSLEEIQIELEKYLRVSLASEETVAHAYEEQLWRQLEDEEIREELHFRFLEKYVQELRGEDYDKAVQIITDYILEKQYFGLKEWEQKGKDFLDSIFISKATVI